MLQALKAALAGRAHSGDAPADGGDKPLRIAAAALLFEVSRSDGEVSDEERILMRAAIQSLLDLPPAGVEELLRAAEAESRSAASLYEFTRIVDVELSPEEKKRVVELLWLVAFADGRKDAHEEHLVRKIAGLLHVPHPDFIDAKIKARDRPGL